MRTIRRYILEAVAPVSRDLSAEGGQTLRSLPLRHFPTRSNLFFEPMEEALHGNTVVDVCLTEILYL